MKQGNRKRKFLRCAAGTLCVLALWTVWGNTALEIERFTIISSKLPLAFDGYKIAQVSDLHNAAYGTGNQRLLSLLEDEKPDIIVLTGDILDAADPNVDAGTSFVRRAVQIAPCYYVTGNHEAAVLAGQPEVYREWVSAVRKAGVRLLRNEALSLERGKESVALLGLSDPGFAAGCPYAEIPDLIHKELEGLTCPQNFQILLAHHPEYFAVYCSAGVDLVFSGHTHGGQWRIPGIGGLAAPGQGLFPTYDAGLFSVGNTSMIISRGLDNTRTVPRIFNRPEVVVAQLRCKTGQ